MDSSAPSTGAPPAGRHHPTQLPGQLHWAGSPQPRARRPFHPSEGPWASPAALGAERATPGPRADMCVFPLPCPLAWWAGGPDALPAHGRGRHLDERGCRRGICLLKCFWFLACWTFRAKPRIPWKDRRQAHAPAETERQASWALLGPLRAAGPPQTRPVPPESLCPGAASWGLEGHHLLGVCSQGWPPPPPASRAEGPGDAAPSLSTPGPPRERKEGDG